MVSSHFSDCPVCLKGTRFLPVSFLSGTLEAACGVPVPLVSGD